MLIDTTLQDGPLSPEVSFTQEQRIEIACALESAGMDVIEIAFPGMHTEDIPSRRSNWGVVIGIRSQLPLILETTVI